MKFVIRFACLLSAFALSVLSARADAPRYGGIHFKTAVEVDGVAYPAETTIYAETWPTQMVVRPIVPDGETFQWFSCPIPRATYLNKRSTENSFYSGFNAKFPTVRLAGRDGTFVMTPPADPSVVLTNSAVYAQKVVYVAPDGSDAETSGSEAQPFATIQYAVDFLYQNWKYANTMVLVKPGVYDKGGYDGDANNFRSRVFVHADQSVLIKSTAGAAQTVIEGELDPSTETGCGENARRCVTFQLNAGGSACIQGFTFRKGRTRERLTGPLYTNQGGGIGAQRSNYGVSQHIAADCVFVDCLAGYGSGAAWNMWLFRCHVIGGGPTATSSSYLVSSLVDGENAGGMGSFAYQSSGATFGVVALNSVGGSQRLATGGTYYGTVSTQKGKDGTPLGYTWSTDYVVDLDAGDWRPVGGSAADCGASVPSADAETETERDMWHLWTDVTAALACGDLNGDKVVWRDGVPMSGAIMETVRMQTITVTKPKEVGIAISGATAGDTVTTLKVPEGGEVAIERTETGGRYASAVVCGGVTNYFADLPGGRFVYVVAEGEAEADLEVLVSKDWYVSPDGDDGAKGFLPTCAFRTLCFAMRKCAAGERVLALPGTYAEGVTDRSGNAVPDGSLPLCRVAGKRGCVLESLAGPEKTVIMGAPSTDESADEVGCGPGAVSCVRMTLAKSGADLEMVVRGFTLTGGRTALTGADELTSGAAAYALWSENELCNRFENCIITNNFSVNNTFYGVALVGCVVADNETVAANGATSGLKSRYLGTHVKNGTVVNAFELRNSTVGRAATFSMSSEYPNCVNSLIMGTVGWHNNSMTFTNCVFLSGTERYQRVDCIIADENEIGVDENGVPMSKRGAVVDAAGSKYETSPYVFACRDARGGQRVYNGSLDVGAIEHDWREDYANDITRRNLNVTAATPNVVERDGRVTLDPGASLSAEWSATEVPAVCEVRARVTGAGTLTVTVDDEVVSTVTAAQSPAAVLFKREMAGTARIVLAYAAPETDAGWAVIDKIHAQQGVVLMLR